MPPTPAGRKAGAGKAPWTVVLLAALPWEVRPFLRLVAAWRTDVGDLPAWEFIGEGGRGLVALTGMGPQAARRAVAFLLARRPQVLVSCGFGGALTPELNPGDLVVGESFRCFRPNNAGLEAIPGPLSPLPVPELVRLLKEGGLAAFAGTLVTTGGVIHKGRQGGALLTLRHPVVDLETSFLAEMAAAAGLPFVGLRTVTDTAGEEIPDFLRGADGEAGPVGPRQALGWLTKDPRRLGTLIKLWRRSRLGGQTLARALLLLLPGLMARGPELEPQPA